MAYFLTLSGHLYSVLDQKQQNHRESHLVGLINISMHLNHTNHLHLRRHYTHHVHLQSLRFLGRERLQCFQVADKFQYLDIFQDMVLLLLTNGLWSNHQ